MGGGGSKGSSSSTTTNNIPTELKPLYTQTGENIQELQTSLPLTDFTGAHPLEVAPLSETQNLSLSRLNEALNWGDLEEAPTVAAGRRYFNANIAPQLEQRAALSGLGRSTALTNGLASAEASTILPLIQAEQQRRDALIPLGLQGGAVARGAEQDVNTAEYQDFLRQQGLSEQALFGPMGQLPSTFGQTTTTKTSGGSGGAFK